MPYKDKEKRLEYYKQYHAEHSAKFTTTFRKEEKARYEKEAHDRGMSLGGFIKYCMDKEISGE